MSSPVTTMRIDLDDGLTDTITSMLAFIPKLLIFLVVLLIGWLVAKAVAKLLGVALDKAGVDTLLARAGAERTLGRAGIEPIGLVCKLVYYFILLIALQLALTAFGPSNPVSDIVNDILRWLPNLFVAIVIIVVAAAVANAVKDIVGPTLATLSYGGFLTKLLGGFIVALGVIAALNQIGIGLTVTLPVLVAVLATIGGILVVGVGGGLIGPMRSRWEGWLAQVESDSRTLREGSGATATSGSAYAGSSTSYVDTPTVQAPAVSPDEPRSPGDPR